MKTFDRILSAIEAAFLWVSVAALVGASLMVLFAVPARTFPAFAVPDNVLFVEVLLLVSISMGLGRTTGLGEHISVDLLYARFPPRLKKATRFLALFAGLVFFLPLAWWYATLAVDFFESGRTQYGSLRLPKWPPYVVISLGFWLVSFRLLYQLMDGARETDADGHGHEAEAEY